MNATMMAAVLHGAEDLRLETRSRPEAKPGMVLLRCRRVGICGSDLHYFEDGSCAAFVPDRPFTLGHEVSAEVETVGDGVETLRVGDRVAVNPARACGVCDYCRDGRLNLCRKTIMLGSASTKPPTDGAWAEFVAVRADQCHLLPSGMDDGLGAMMEPFAVALHAVRRSRGVAGKRVLVAGGGTIGVLVGLAARAYGAVPVAVSDIVEARRKNAVSLGLDVALDPTAQGLREQVRELTGEGFDVVFEASGARSALRQAFDLVRPGGTIVQVGTLGTEDIPLPVNLVMIREINLVGSMRYGNVFGEAIRLVAAGRINLKPLISRVLPFKESVEAIRLAADKSRVLKVQVEI